MDFKDIDLTLSRRNLIIGGAMSAAFTGFAPMAASAATQQNYAEKTLTVGLYSGDISALAEQKAFNAHVRVFAGLELGEANAVGALLLGAGASKPPRPDNFAKTLKQLQDMDAGFAFDRLYVASEIEGHEALLKIQSAEAASSVGGVDGAISAVLVPFIESHLVMLRTLDRALAAAPQ